MAQDTHNPAPPSPATASGAEPPPVSAAAPALTLEDKPPADAASAAAPVAEAPAPEAPPPQAGPQPLHPPHLIAAVAEAMVLSGLGNKANLVETVLLSAMARFVNQGTVDLGILWRTLVTDMFQPKDKTAQAMLLTASYVAKTFEVPVTVPEEAQELMETLLPSEEERATAGDRLSAAVEARMNRSQVAASGAAAAALAAAVATSGKHGPGVSTSGKHGPAKPEPPKVADLLKPDLRKKKAKAAIDLNDPRVAVVSGLLFLVLCGYWVNELVVKEIQLDRKRQEFYTKRTIETEKLPPGFQVKEAFMVGPVLKIHLADDKLAQTPDQQRAQYGADLLASLDQLGALRVSLFSDAKRYVVRKDADGLVTVHVAAAD